MRTLCFALVLILHPSLLQAQSGAGEAEQLFDQARADMTEGRYSTACPKLERSQALDPQLGTLLHLAHCYEKVGRLADAWNRFREASRLAAERGDGGQADPRADVAQRRATAIEPQVSLVTLAIADPKLAGLAIDHDGRAMPAEAWTRPLAVASGTHRLIARAPDRSPWQHDYAVSREPQRLQIDVPALARPEPVALPAPAIEASVVQAADNPGDVQRIVAYALGGAGIVAAGFATGFYIAAEKASDKQDPIWEECQKGETCDEEGNNELEETIQNNAERARISLAISGTLLVGAVVVWLTAPNREEKPPVAVGIAPGGAWISVRGSTF